MERLGYMYFKWGSGGGVRGVVGPKGIRNFGDVRGMYVQAFVM